MEGWTAYGAEVPSSGMREFVGAMLLILGFLFWLGGAGHLSLWFSLLSGTGSERIGKVMMWTGAALVVSALL
jgi:hypothetical protein